jgi:hypothetical protein
MRNISFLFNVQKERKEQQIEAAQNTPTVCPNNFYMSARPSMKLITGRWNMMSIFNFPLL